jgi:hypothetical protein
MGIAVLDGVEAACGEEALLEEADCALDAAFLVRLARRAEPRLDL